MDEDRSNSSAMCLPAQVGSRTGLARDTAQIPLRTVFWLGEGGVLVEGMVRFWPAVRLTVSVLYGEFTVTGGVSLGPVPMDGLRK
jgi:hypothetical protein